MPKRHSTRPADRRGGRVIFLAHCLLNENTRYAGGACRACAVDEIVRACLDRELGIVQLPCPEEVAWGGVPKRWFLRVYGLSARLGPRALRMLGHGARIATAFRYRRLAARVARQIADYRRAGYEVAGIVGVDGSPSCGVTATIFIPDAVPVFAALDPERLTAEAQNRAVVSLIRPGRGIFISALAGALGRRGIDLPILGHDLRDELEGRPSRVDLGALTGRKAAVGATEPPPA